MDGDGKRNLESLEIELEEIEKIIEDEKGNENIEKIETFMTDFILFIEIYIHEVRESPPYQRLSKLYLEDKIFILNMGHIIPICKGFLRNLKR